MLDMSFMPSIENMSLFQAASPPRMPWSIVTAGALSPDVISFGVSGSFEQDAPIVVCLMKDGSVPAVSAGNGVAAVAVEVALAAMEEPMSVATNMVVRTAVRTILCGCDLVLDAMMWVERCGGRRGAQRVVRKRVLERGKYNDETARREPVMR